MKKGIFTTILFPLLLPPLVIAEEVPLDEAQEASLDEHAPVIISEIYPNPPGGSSEEKLEEFIELQNIGESDVDLKDLCLRRESKTSCFSSPHILAPGEYITIWRSEKPGEEREMIQETSLVLRNSGETVELVDSSGDILSTLSSGTAPEGESLSSDGSWCLPTPGSENCTSPSPEEPEPPEEPIDPPEEPVDPPIDLTQIKINELVSNPEEGSEWAEIISFSDEEIDLSGFVLADEVSDFYSIPEGTSLSPNEYLVLEWNTSKLNNSGDTLFFKTPDGDIVDETTFGSLKKGESWSLIDEVFLVSSLVTKGAENKIPKEEIPNNEEIPVQPSGSLLINELVSNPESGNEWVELFSLSHEEVDLRGMIFSDASGDFYTIENTTLLPPGGYLVMEWEASKLNNTGDIFVLKNGAGELIDQTSFGKLEKGESWARFESTFEITTRITYEAENIHLSPSSTSKKKKKKKISPIVRTKATQTSVSRDEIEIVISEVMFRGEAEDFVELYCQKCDTDLKGIRLGDDDVFFEFPPGSTVKNGEYVVIHFSKEKNESYYDKGVWHFWAKKSGLTGTDETIFLLDSWNKLEDGLCIANQNGKFSAYEYEDVVHLVKQKAIFAEHPVKEDWCYDSTLLSKGRSLVRSDLDPNIQGKFPKKSVPQNYFWSDTPTPGKENPLPPVRSVDAPIEIAGFFLISESVAIVEIQNTDSKRVRLDGVTLQYGENTLPLSKRALLGKEKVSIPIFDLSSEEISLRDFWGTEIDIQSISTCVGENPQPDSICQKFEENTSGFIISEILPNPEGVDTGQEFLELQCLQEKCKTRDFLLMIGDSQVDLTPTSLKRGEHLLITDETLRNSDLHISLYSLEEKTVQRIVLEKTEEAKSYAFLKKQKYNWTSYSTPGEKNVFLGDQTHLDTDEDGIPDSIELSLGSNPYQADSKNSTVFQKYKKSLQKKIELTVKEKEDAIEFTGTTLPHTKMRLVLNSERHVFSSTSDAEGKYSFTASPDISPGEHSVDILVSASKSNLFVFPEVETISLTRNPQQNWLKDISLFRVLPNPNGKDTDREMILLENTTNSSGWLKKAKFVFGDKKVDIPDTFFKPGQKKIFTADEIPSLRNSVGDLKIMGYGGKIFSQVSWEKARSGEWFGEGIERIYTPKKKKSSSRKYRPPIIPFIEEIPEITEFSGIFLGTKDNSIKILLSDGSEALIPMSENFSPNILSRLFQEASFSSFSLQEGKLIQIDLPHQRGYYSLQIEKMDIWIWGIFGVSVFLFFFGASLVKRLSRISEFQFP